MRNNAYRVRKENASKLSIGCSMRQICINLISSVSLATITFLFAGCTTTTTEYSSAVMRNMVSETENIMATGYAVISVQMNDNPAQQRLLSIRASKLDAYRSLLEQVYGQYLDVNTTVGEMVVQSDTFRARVQGVIYGAQLVSITPVGDDTYTVTLSLSRSIVDDLRHLYIDQMSRNNSTAVRKTAQTPSQMAQSKPVSVKRGV